MSRAHYTINLDPRYGISEIGTIHYRYVYVYIYIVQRCDIAAPQTVDTTMSHNARASLGRNPSSGLSRPITSPNLIAAYR